MSKNIEHINQLIEEHLKRNDIYIKNSPWVVEKSNLGDRGVFATRDIQPGELIFIDYPIIIGPRARLNVSVMCVSCYKSSDLKVCVNGCGLTVCSENCQESPVHKKECAIINGWKNGHKLTGDFEELLRCLTPIRSLILTENEKHLVKALKGHVSPKHGFEVDIMLNKLMLHISEDEDKFMRQVCSILDANAFEVISGEKHTEVSLRGLYPLSSLVNHNCSPNAMHIFDHKQRMIVKATKFIPKNEEIFHSYVKTTWGTLHRRYYLFLTKHFCCYCARCCDPTEFGANMNAVNCESCKGLVLPTNPLKAKSSWQCLGCKKVMDHQKVLFINSVLGSRLESFNEVEDTNTMLEFLTNTLIAHVPESNQIVVELKYRLIWILGYRNGFTWEELSDELLRRKEKFCRDLLELLKLLKTGLCKMRGMLLYELYCCIKERHRRPTVENNQKRGESNILRDEEKGMEALLKESVEILRYDVGVRQELKDMWEYSLQSSETEKKRI